MILKILARTIKHINIVQLCPLSTMTRAKFCFSNLNSEGPGRREKSDEDKLWNEQEWEQSVRWTDNIEQIVPNYPFTHIPIVVIRNPTKFAIPNPLLQNLVAFKLLRAHEQDTLLAGKILFPDQSISIKNGKKLFNLFYEDKCGQLIRRLNKGQGSLNQRITTLLILSNIEKQQLPTESVKQIDVRAINEQDTTGILISYCAQLFIKFNIDYSHLLQLILTKLQDPNNTTAKPKISKAIISTPQFENYFSRKIVDLAIQQITINIKNMHNFQILFVIRNIYNYKSQTAKELAKSVQQYLIKKHVDENSLDFHVPLILKAIKYASKLGVSTKELLSFIQTNMKRFQIIFDKKREAKGLFFSLLFSKPNKQTPPELIGHLKGYFLNELAQFVQSNESEESQLLRFNKLLVKYFDQFTQKQQQYIKHQYIQKLIPYYSESTQVLFYSILIFLRTKPQETTQNSQYEVVKKYIHIFFQRCCNKTNAEQMFVIYHINSVIEMMYQVLRHNISFHKSQLPLICRYDFSKKQSVNPENLSNFFYYLGKSQHQSKQDVKIALLSVQPLLEVYIRGHKINSFKVIMSIMDVCHKVGFEHPFFYKMLENSLAEYLIKNPKFVIIDKDLRFINEKFLKRGFGSSRLKELILGTLQKPRNWEKLRTTYTENQKKFLDSLNSKRKERQSKYRSE